MFDQILSSWKEALENAHLDKAVSIRIAPLTSNGVFDIFVTSLPPGHKIAAHVHSEGNEICFILEGSGEIRQLPLESGESQSFYTLPMKKGDVLAIPPAMIHQLKNTHEKEELVLIFACPPTHLTTDRSLSSDLFTEGEKNKGASKSH